MFKHILVPTDGSQLSSDTVKRAIAFAKETRAKVTFFFAKAGLSGGVSMAKAR
jgi:nucleotide-binding universal stress UspA family protein